MDSSYSTLGNMVYQTSFPVDVVVFIRVEPSIIRFNCLPTSRVECLLKLPALETVFSTKSTDIESGLAEGTPPLKAKGQVLLLFAFLKEGFEGLLFSRSECKCV